MRKIIKLEGIPLTEGHSGLYLDVVNGIVKKGYYYALVPIRGFETLLLDKEAVIAPVITSRVCGLCQITHSIASARAVESAAGIDVPLEAELLREVLGLAVRIYNNLLHQIVISEDIFPKREERFAFIRKVQRIRKFTGEVLESIGGEIIHAPNIKVGGISEPLEDFVREKILASCQEVKPLLKQVFEEFKENIDKFWQKENLEEDFGKHDLPFFATDKFYGKSIDKSKIEFKYPQELFHTSLKREITNIFPYVDGKIVETGPRARKVLFDNYKPIGGVKELHILRALESVEAIERIEEILSSRSFEVEMWNRTFPTSDGEIPGVGVHEAPRGTNIHIVKLDKRGRIVYYKIIVPTEFNFMVISKALEGIPVSKVEIVVRAYDPCTVCAAH
ncbi:Coenzyme F420 hydrogenase [Desulfurobacterium thermolithotrophum DSM 11699]|uniref:Coenzyme F420 hydrogenase n=1 Tax=Desulfurobacterium thermolithotrophum (strain DSM 11699 / BSA) TaxID=868864 RepID=F0S2N1_DESTD|nr:nickel-dependent hydrogenase large subunit [Desulfurobacterium thermolithotrophum]ADY73103.1 Coenzyme F420 hydrogenase [Desulfurobacterium thermolithotrophum DSM 11699]